VTTIALLPGEQPERVLQIPPRSDLYVAEFDTGVIRSVPAANFSKYVDSMLVITEGENEPFGSFTVLQAVGNNITKTRIGLVTGSPHFEGASFVPATSISSTGTQSMVSESTAAGGSTTATLVGGVAVVVAVLILVVFLVSRSRRSRLPR
jgi:hypothetical protein